MNTNRTRRFSRGLLAKAAQAALVGESGSGHDRPRRGIAQEATLFLNVEEVACRLSVREDKVRLWIEQGSLPATSWEKKNDYWIDEVDLLCFLKTHDGLAAA